MSLIADYLKGPAERPLMIWSHNNPSIVRLQRYLNDYKREDGTKLFRLGYPVRDSSYRLVLVDGKAKEIDGSISDYPDIAFLPYYSICTFFSPGRSDELYPNFFPNHLEKP